MALIRKMVVIAAAGGGGRGARIWWRVGYVMVIYEMKRE